MIPDCPNCGKWIEAATEAARERNAMKDKLVACQGRNDKLAEALKHIAAVRGVCSIYCGCSGCVAAKALAAYSEPHTPISASAKPGAAPASASSGG